MGDEDRTIASADMHVPPPAFETWFARFDPDHEHIERLKFLSDGVFAIAMTLLAIEIKPPEAWNGRFDGLGHEFIVGCVAYLVGFAILGGLWAQQRRMLALLVRIDHVTVALTLATLAGVCLLPAGIGLQIRYSTLPNSFVIYGSLFLAVTASSTVFWFYVAIWRRLVVDTLPDRYRRGQLAMQLLSSLGLGFAIIGFAYSSAGDDIGSASAPWLVAAFVFLAASTPVRRWSRKIPAVPIEPIAPAA